MKFSRSDAAFTFVIGVLSAFLIVLFLQDINAVSLRRDAPELGTIVFRKRTATRKSAGSLRWERLKNLSTIHQGDTLRTAGASEAAVNFEDGTSLDIFENSMLRLNFTGDIPEIEFLGGAISLGGSDSAETARRSVLVGSTRVEVAGQSRVSLLQDGTTLAVDVTAGEALVTVDGAQGTRVAVNQELRINSKTGSSELIERQLIPLSPAQSARLLDQSPAAAFSGLSAVEFSAEERGASASGEDGTVYIEVARDAAFTEEARRVSAEYSARTLSARTDLASGTWFWRLADSAGRESAVRRFSLVQEAPPRLILPAEGDSFSWRTNPARIRFSWSGCESALAYILEIDNDQNFGAPAVRTRTALTGLTISTLTDGQWYWRVVPVYSHTLSGPAAVPEARGLRLSRSAAMTALSPVLPVDGTLFQISRIIEKGISFSWTPEREAAEYQLVISANPGLEPALAVLPSAQPYYRPAAGQFTALAREGTLYWAVRWMDAEGNLSPLSAPRRLVAVDELHAVRALFPPDGYTIADSLVTNTRFTWRSTVNSRTDYQLARDPLFRDVVLNETVTGDSLLGRELAPGQYFWRVRTFNIDDSVFLETAARRVQVAPPLPPPALLQPAPGSAFPVVEGSSIAVRWSEVSGADYYRLQLYHSGGSGEPDFELPIITDTQSEVPLGKMQEGPYRIVLQAFALDTDESTRIIGYRSESAITMRKLLPVRLGSPANGELLDGLTLRRYGLTFSWASRDTPTALRLALKRDGQSFSLPFVYESGADSYTVRNLPEGRYEWSVHASLDEFDISSRGAESFSVSAIPLLPAPALTGPANSAEFGPEQLRSSRTIRFSWTAVAGASRYTLKIFRSGSSDPVWMRDDLEGTECVLEDLTVLARGDFIWEVSAQSYWTDGVLEQEGRESRQSFRVVLPGLGNPAPIKGKEFYGL